MIKNSLHRRWGVCILAIILVFGVICGIIFELKKAQGGNEIKESPLVGCLVFEYDEGGTYGSLYYQAFTGEKTLISDHLLGEDGEHFILDERRKLVFYKDEEGALYITEIGKDPKQIVTFIDEVGILESKSGRYLVCASYDEDKLISYFVIDKEERVAHEVKTGLNTDQLYRGLREIAFDEEGLMLSYRDSEQHLYCSTAYKAPQLIANDYVRQADGIILYMASDQKEGGYTFLNGRMKGELLKAGDISDFLVENIDGKSTTFFIGKGKEGEGLYMQRKGEESIALARGDVAEFKYISETNKLYYLLSEGNLVCLDINTAHNSAVAKEKELATKMDSFNISPNGMLVVGTRYCRGSGKNLYLITEEAVVSLANAVEASQVFDTYVIYQGENNQGYVKTIVNNKVVEETILPCLECDDYLRENYSVTPQGTYVTYFEKKEGQTCLMLYTKEQGIQTLIENVDNYDRVKINNRFYKSPLKYNQVIGYYANEAFDILLEMTKNQEMIIYSGGQEKGRVVFKVAKAEEKEQLKFTPLSGIDFTIDIFKNTFWNDEVFLSRNTIFEKDDYLDKIELILADKTLTLISLDEAEFRNQLRGQRDTSKESKEELLTQREAILFTKWYVSYLGQEMPAYIEVDHEEGDYYIVHTYDNTHILSGYQVDKRSGEIIPLERQATLAHREYKDRMTYNVEDDVLWMVDEQGNKGRLVNLDAFYKKDYDRVEETGDFLWQYGSNIYFVIKRYDALEEYNEDTLWRYDLIKRKATRLTETMSVFDRGVAYILEPERGTIRVEYCAYRHDLSRERINLITGEHQEWIAQYHHSGNCTITQEGELIYEVVCPKGERSFFISEYNLATKEQRLLCKVDDGDFYAHFCPKDAIKVGDDIYFMDYTHYLTPEEAEQDGEFEGAYCKVNVKTTQVSRVSKETYESLAKPS